MDTTTISGSIGDLYITNGVSPNWSDTLTIGTTIPSSIQPRNTVQINGEGADILVNGESVMDTLRGIQDRLNILRPNPQLEAEWDELREAGERYRELERQFAEKSKMWNTLRQMPPPEIK
jgi:hypothetical protein